MFTTLAVAAPLRATLACSVDGVRRERTLGIDICDQADVSVGPSTRPALLAWISRMTVFLWKIAYAVLPSSFQACFTLSSSFNCRSRTQGA